jgi:hypothetical protein
MRSFIVVLFLLVSVNLYAQKDESDVAKAVERLNQAVIDGKKEALEKIAADDLTYGHSNGLIEDKAAFIQNLVSGNSDFVKITPSEQVIRVTGNVATARHKAFCETNNNGTAGTVNLSVLFVWIKVKGEWKLIARQAVKI